VAKIVASLEEGKVEEKQARKRAEEATGVQT
jgi:hypothetical protein